MDIKNFNQTIEGIINSATPAQRIAWDNIFRLVGDRFTVSPFYYMGSIAGLDELLVYRARRIYLAYEISATQGAVGAGISYLVLYNEANVISSVLFNLSMIWNTTTLALNYCPNYINETNVYFSRTAPTGYACIKFNGYRIIY